MSVYALSQSPRAAQPRLPGAQHSRSAETFYAWLEQGRLPVPFCVCLSQDFEAAYRIFCREHELEPGHLVHTVRGIAEVKRINMRVSELEAGRQRRVLLVGFRPAERPCGDHPEAVARRLARDRQRIQRELRQFRVALTVWRARSAQSGEGGEGYRQRGEEPST